MRKSRLPKRWLIISSASSILIIGLIILTLWSNYQIKGVVSERDTSLDVYEATKIWVMDDIRTFLTIDDEDSYNSAKKEIHMTSELKSELFRGTYAKFNEGNIDEVVFIDAQYSIDKEDNFMVYLLANVKGEETKQVNILVSINSNMIYDVLIY